MLARPDVGAVGGHHERKVAEERDGADAVARVLPLLVREPLQVLVEEDLGLELLARAASAPRSRRRSGSSHSVHDRPPLRSRSARKSA